MQPFGFSMKMVPLSEQLCALKYRTPEHLTSMPNAAIAQRVQLAQEVALRAVQLARDSNGQLSLEDALAQSRQLLSLTPSPNPVD